MPAFRRLSAGYRMTQIFPARRDNCMAGARLRRCNSNFESRAIHDAASAGLSGRRAHHRQPLHPAGAAFRLRPRRPAFPAPDLAAAGGHGGDVRRCRQPGGGGRRLGGERQSIWPHRRHGPADLVRLTLLSRTLGRASDPAAGGAGRPPFRRGGRAKPASAPRSFWASPPACYGRPAPGRSWAWC